MIDIRGRLGKWPLKWRGWEDDWKAARDLVLAGDDTATCNSWECGDDVIHRNCSGILYPSMMNAGGTNLVLYPEHTIGGVRLCQIHDPMDEIRKANPPITG